MNLELAIKTLRDNGYTVSKKRAKKVNADFADYDLSKIKNTKIQFPSPVIAATFEDGEYIRMSFATVVGKPLNVGRAVRVAVDAHDARHKVRERKAIAERFASEIETHKDVVSKREHCDEMRAQAVEAAEAYNEFITKNPDTWSGRYQLESAADNWSERYSVAIAHIGHAKEEVLRGLVKKHGKKVNRAEITHAHIELGGKKVTALDLEKVKAVAKAKLNGGLH